MHVSSLLPYICTSLGLRQVTIVWRDRYHLRSLGKKKEKKSVQRKSEKAAVG